jgi:Integrase core domain.
VSICEYAKTHSRSTSGNHQSTNATTDGTLKDGHIRPGANVSTDHFESRLKGRTYTSFGKTTSDQYVGGCIFVDHMSGYLHVEHQLGFSSSETIRAKQNFEQLALGHGVLIEEYLADNGVFSKTKFVDHIRQHNQQLRFCGVNAHHKNAVAERAIRTVSELSRALLLHASTHWPNGIDASLWPMAVDYATHLYNTLPNLNGICPADLFTGTTVPRHKLRDLHVWGCPVYVLDPTLQQGKKLPRWQPRSRRGVFVGYSRFHSSDVPLVLNLQTGSISPQFHVVFDDSFSTVPSIGIDDEPPSFWTAPNLESCILRIPLDADDPSMSLLQDDWLTPSELEEKRRQIHRQTQIRSSFIPSPTPGLGPQRTSHDASSQSTSPGDIGVSHGDSHGALPSASRNGDTGVSHGDSHGDLPSASSDVPSSPPSGVSVADHSSSNPSSTAVPSSVDPPDPSPSSSAVLPSTAPLRRSSRSTKGTFNSTKYIDEVYLSTILEAPKSSHELELAYNSRATY